MNDYPMGWTPPTQPSPLEEALSSKLDALVAAGELTESQAAGLVPGYQYPELLLWVRPPADELNPPSLDTVLQMSERLRTEQARQRYWQARAQAEIQLQDALHHDSDGLDDGT